MADEHFFGYPTECTKCKNISDSITAKLTTMPYFKKSGELRMMLIGQDPTIYKNPDRVKYVLMLNERNGQLSRWLRSLLGEDNYNKATLYATNLIKCSFSIPPSSSEEGSYKFLLPYFENCKHHMYHELANYKPSLVITLGESAHRMFRSILNNSNEIADSMKNAFTGEFIKASFSDIEFDYSPCLHIKTYRVADTYGEKINIFTNTVSEYFTKYGHGHSL